MSELTRKIEDGDLFLMIDDLSFWVTYHRGKDAIRARRLVKKLMAPQIAQQAAMIEQIEAKMPKEDREKLAELREQAQALDGTPKGKEAEKALQALLSRHQNQSEGMIAYAKMMESLDLDQEEILDALAFKYTKVKAAFTGGKYVSLNDDLVFNTVFAGEASEYVDQVREEVINFNGFLGRSQNEATPEPAKA